MTEEYQAVNVSVKVDILRSEVRTLFHTQNVLEDIFTWCWNFGCLLQIYHIKLRKLNEVEPSFLIYFYQKDSIHSGTKVYAEGFIGWWLQHNLMICIKGNWNRESCILSRINVALMLIWFLWIINMPISSECDHSHAIPLHRVASSPEYMLSSC